MRSVNQDVAIEAADEFATRLRVQFVEHFGQNAAVAKFDEAQKRLSCTQRIIAPTARGPRARGVETVVGRAVISDHDLQIRRIMRERRLQIVEQIAKKIACSIATTRTTVVVIWNDDGDEWHRKCLC